MTKLNFNKQPVAVCVGGLSLLIQSTDQRYSRYLPDKPAFVQSRVQYVLKVICPPNPVGCQLSQTKLSSHSIVFFCCQYAEQITQPRHIREHGGQSGQAEGGHPGQVKVGLHGPHTRLQIQVSHNIWILGTESGAALLRS